LTRGAFEDVQRLFPGNPGRLNAFAWPVSREQAMELLGASFDFRLTGFGACQDAMWTEEPLLYHSGLCAALNLKLPDSREVIEAAVVAHEVGRPSLASLGGFVPRILGWREHVRGVYWSATPWAPSGRCRSFTGAAILR
jgi:deoxyribodipyrimidine photolyase-related protein